MFRKAFTQAEAATVALTLAILCAVALPAYSDYKTDARRTACKGALGAMRAAIANFHAASHGEQAIAYPTVAQLTSCGAVLADVVPDNPFSTGDCKNTVVESSGNKGDTTGLASGWCYNSATGVIWANRNTPEVGENAF